MKSYRILVLIACLLSASVHAQTPARAFVPEAGFVPDEETAIRIAVAVWEPIYGKENIAHETPYRAALKNGVWQVNGSLPLGMAGGTAFAAISKKDGTVLSVFHGK